MERDRRVAALLAMTGFDRFVFHHSRHAERGGGDTRDEIWSIAQRCRMARVMRPYLEMVR
ncbi:MAG: hypothetical protein ACYTGH_14130 [Planctomycetota bacterium]